MLVRVALVMLALWLFGVLGPFDAGALVHMLLLLGLMLLLIGGLQARDAAMRQEPPTTGKR